MEFIVSDHIGVHPMALVHPDKVTSMQSATIDRFDATLRRPGGFFVERLAEGIGMLAAAFYPKPVIIRMSDFKTNEYAGLIGGAGSSRRKKTL